jgi:hypothetical protein
VERAGYALLITGYAIAAIIVLAWALTAIF